MSRFFGRAVESPGTLVGLEPITPLACCRLGPEAPPTPICPGLAFWGAPTLWVSLEDPGQFCINLTPPHLQKTDSAACGKNRSKRKRLSELYAVPALQS